MLDAEQQQMWMDLMRVDGPDTPDQAAFGIDDAGTFFASSASLFATTPFLSFPDVIETAEDGPVLLNPLITDERDQIEGGLLITRIDGRELAPSDATELPGIRVGAGDGSGFVFRRALDGELVYVPDAGYSGITTFAYTVADRTGDEATLLATVSVRPNTGWPADIWFADGTQSAVVTEGIDSAILGALTLGSFDLDAQFDFSVYEGAADVPSQRFMVVGDKLKTVAPLHSDDDGIIVLRVVASDDGEQIAATELSIEVRPVVIPLLDEDQFAFAADRNADGPEQVLRVPSLVYSSDSEIAATIEDFKPLSQTDVIEAADDGASSAARPSSGSDVDVF